MTKLIVKDYNDETKQIIEREMNAEELAQYEKDKAQAGQTHAQAEAKAQAKANAEAKLATLGLTTEDLRALGL